MNQELGLTYQGALASEKRSFVRLATFIFVASPRAKGLVMIPIIVLSFDRPNILRRFLASLKQQIRQVDPTSVYLFQDGPTGNDSSLQQSCIDEFYSFFPDAKVFKSDDNIGTALNFERAESFAFETLNAPIAYFFEDDLELSPHYLEMLDQMGDFALADERIGYVAAYGDHHLSLERQASRKGEYIPLGHKWGFALTRRQWLKQKPIVDGYLKLVRGKNYRQRDGNAIRNYFQGLGYSSAGTSQDAAKDVACCVTGSAKINTAICFGKNIGSHGLHTREKFYIEQGYDKTVLFGEAVTLRPPSSDELDRALAAERLNGRNWFEKNKKSDAPVDKVAALKAKLFGVDIFSGYSPSLSEPDLQGWNGTHPALTRAVQGENPQIIIDVGVWKGQSTVTLANAQSGRRDDGYVLAVDTFLGSPQHWNVARDDVYPSLGFRHGLPSFYETFLSNIVLSGLTKRVVPIAQTSENAARMLSEGGIKAQLIHLDAAHDYEPALRDMRLFWDLLTPGGLLIGDDFTWAGVARAVVHFADEIGVPFAVENPKWIIRKPHLPQQAT